MLTYLQGIRTKRKNKLLQFFYLAAALHLIAFIMFIFFGKSKTLNLVISKNVNLDKNITFVPSLKKSNNFSKKLQSSTPKKIFKGATDLASNKTLPKPQNILKKEVPKKKGASKKR